MGIVEISFTIKELYQALVNIKELAKILSIFTWLNAINIVLQLKVVLRCRRGYQHLYGFQFERRYTIQKVPAKL